MNFLHEIPAWFDRHPEAPYLIAGGAFVYSAAAYWGLQRLVNKGVDTSSPSGKMLWTAPLGDGTKSKGESTSCPFPPQPPHHEPHYLIQLAGTGLYLGSAYRWVRPTGYALRFGSVTAANAYAVCQLGLRLDEYTVEYVAGVTVTPINRGGENRL